MHNAGSFLCCNKKCLKILMVLLFFILTFSFIRNYKMSDEIYSSDGFQVEFLHDERGKLIKSDSLFNSVYDFGVCIHAAAFMKVNRWYHPKTAKLEKVFYVRVGVNDVKLVKKCLMYLKSYKIPIFLYQILRLQTMMNKNLINH